MNYFFTPSFTDTCTPLSTFQYSIQLAFGSLFGLCLLITMIWAPNAYRMSLSAPSCRSLSPTSRFFSLFRCQACR